MKQQITKPEPKKIGRPRVYKEPLTNAERQQRWRDKIKADALVLLQQINNCT